MYYICYNKNKSDMKFHSYTDWLEKQKSNPLIHEVLTQLEPKIVEMLDAAKDWYKEKTGQPMDDYDETLYKLSITRDLVNSFETYTAPDDKLVSLSARGSANGSIRIEAKIQRSDNKYPFETDVIYAGGYNIQRLHFRYITKTTLPKIGDFTLTRQLDAQLKGLSKAEKVKEKIEQQKAYINTNLAKIARNSAYTDEQIIEILKADKNKHFTEWPTWEELGSWGAQKNYNNDRESYEKQKADYVPNAIAFWKKVYITWTEENTTALRKELSKLEKKLEVIMASL